MCLFSCSAFFNLSQTNKKEVTHRELDSVAAWNHVSYPRKGMTIDLTGLRLRPSCMDFHGCGTYLALATTRITETVTTPGAGGTAVNAEGRKLAKYPDIF